MMLIVDVLRCRIGQNLLINIKDIINILPIPTILETLLVCCVSATDVPMTEKHEHHKKAYLEYSSS
jgi:hypothetical protein